MRDQLAKIEGTRATFQGVFVRYGTKKGYKGYPIKTILLKDVCSVLTKQVMTDHLWFTSGKRLESLNLKENDIVRFDARVTSYEKGYKGYREDVYDSPVQIDFRLSFPTNVVKLDQSIIQPVFKLQL